MSSLLEAVNRLENASQVLSSKSSSTKLERKLRPAIRIMKRAFMNAGARIKNERIISEKNGIWFSFDGDVDEVIAALSDFLGSFAPLSGRHVIPGKSVEFIRRPFHYAVIGHDAFVKLIHR